MLIQFGDNKLLLLCCRQIYRPDNRRVGRCSVQVAGGALGVYFCWIAVLHSLVKTNLTIFIVHFKSASPVTASSRGFRFLIPTSRLKLVLIIFFSHTRSRIGISIQPTNAPTASPCSILFLPPIPQETFYLGILYIHLFEKQTNN